MDFEIEAAIRAELNNLVGHNVKPTIELERLLYKAYQKGRADVLEAVGLDESEISSESGYIAWTA